MTNKPKNKSKGRTMSITFRGTKVMIREGYDGTLEIVAGKHRERGEWKTFDAACRYALKWVLANGGVMTEEPYRRDVT